MRIAITVGIGLFLAHHRAEERRHRRRRRRPPTSRSATCTQPSVVLAALGFLLIVVLDRLKVPGAILIGILAVTRARFVFGGNKFAGVFSAPPSIAPTFLQLDIRARCQGGILNVVLVFFLVELFDATGTLMGVAKPRRPAAPKARWSG